MVPFLHELESTVSSIRSKTGMRLSPWPLVILGLALLLMAFVFMPKVVALALSIALFLAPLWLPVLLVGAAWEIWLVWRRSEYITKQKYILLEVRPPRAIAKTPLAMEAVLSGIHLSPGESTWYKKFIAGAVRPYWSLEIASIGGQVHFFIWTRAGFRRLVEAQIYAQYPGAQVTEATDYSRVISGSPHEWGIWGCDFIHTKADPYPIKTYVEYGLDKVQKEPEQVDPLANLLEFMGSMRKGEQLWLQLIVRVHKGEKYAHLSTDEGKPVKDWKDLANGIIADIRKKTVGKVKYKDVFTGEMRETEGFPNPTKGQSEMIAAIERNVSKLAFDVGARGVYIAEPDKFDGVNITGLVGIFKQFNSEGWNGFRPNGWLTIFDDYPWEFRVEKLKHEFAEALIDAYRRRSFYFEPYTGEAMVMSTEELATIFHIPSRAVETPTLPRIQSATGEAPPNLPT